MAISGAIHHPDYLAYFNEFAMGHPEAILVDSNYDWGQDYKLLSERLRELGVTKFFLASGVSDRHYGFFEAWYHLPTIDRANDFVSSPGWTAVSTTYDKSTRFTRYGQNWTPFWFDRAIPSERVGAILLFYAPPRDETKPSPDPPGAGKTEPK
jgi:hypothetical protein